MISFEHTLLPLKNQLYRLALRITMNREDAEDIVQETLIKVWNKREEWNKIDSVEAYTLAICRNLSIDHVRLRRTDSSTDVEEVRQLQTNPFEQILQRDKIQVVRELIDTLPEKQKTAIQLRDFEGKSYKEIALVMGITEEQVKVNIFRARQTVKSKYEKIEEYGL